MFTCVFLTFRLGCWLHFGCWFMVSSFVLICLGLCCWALCLDICYYNWVWVECWWFWGSWFAEWFVFMFVLFEISCLLTLMGSVIACVLVFFACCCVCFELFFLCIILCLLGFIEVFWCWLIYCFSLDCLLFSIWCLLVADWCFGLFWLLLILCGFGLYLFVLYFGWWFVFLIVLRLISGMFGCIWFLFCITWCICVVWVCLNLFCDWNLLVDC